MAIQQLYDLDLIPNSVPLVVKASQYDRTSRLLIFNIYKQGELFTIPSGSTVTIRGTKKDLTGFEYPCSYANSEVTAVLEEQMTIFSGKYPVELRIAQGSSILGTANFILEVEESPLKDDTVISTSQMPLLEEALEASVRAQQSANEASTSAQIVSALIPSDVGSDGQFLSKNGSGAEWSDVEASNVIFTSPNISATNVQSAIEEIMPKKKIVTISSATSGTYIDNMTYKYEVAWQGVNATEYFGDIADVENYDVKNGLYIETAQDKVILYFGANPSGASMTVLVERVVDTND